MLQQVISRWRQLGVIIAIRRNYAEIIAPAVGSRRGRSQPRHHCCRWIQERSACRRRRTRKVLCFCGFVAATDRILLSIAEPVAKEFQGSRSFAIEPTVVDSSRETSEKDTYSKVLNLFMSANLTRSDSSLPIKSQSLLRFSQFVHSKEEDWEQQRKKRRRFDETLRSSKGSRSPSPEMSPRSPFTAAQA